MSIEISTRPSAVSVATSLPAPAPQASQAAVATTLPPAKAVTATGSANGPAVTRPDGGAVAQQAFIDQAAGELVYREVDLLTNYVVKQFPEETLLRARAYYRAQDSERLVAVPASVNSKA